jgi:hypothetical protein
MKYIGHFHNDNVFIIQDQKRNMILKSLQKQVKQVGHDLGVIYKQQFELKLYNHYFGVLT